MPSISVIREDHVLQEHLDLIKSTQVDYYSKGCDACIKYSKLLVLFSTFDCVITKQITLIWNEYPA